MKKVNTNVYKYVIYHSCNVLESLKMYPENSREVLGFGYGKGAGTLSTVSSLCLKIV